MFAGYPAGATRTAVPNAFFVEVLPRLAGRPVDVIVAVYAFFAIGRKRGSPRHVTQAELLADEPLRQAVRAAAGQGILDQESISDAIVGSLDALRRGGLLLTVAMGAGGEPVYLLPTPADRRAAALLRARGRTEEGKRAMVTPSLRDGEEGPGIVAWYESAIGTVPPFLVDELHEAEAMYPAAWIEEAFREAAVLNHRSWRYVRRILERWAEEGRDDHAKTERDPVARQRRRYLGGRWSDLVR